MQTLVLNAGYEPMHLVSWQKALCLVLSSKAEIVAEYDQVVRSVSQIFKLPSVVRLKRYVKSLRRAIGVRCTRRNILVRDRFQCQYCGVFCQSSVITIDHVIPRSKGGSTTWENVVAACSHCNRRKGSKAIEQVGLRLLRPPRRPTWFELLGDHHQDVLHSWLPFLGRTG